MPVHAKLYTGGQLLRLKSFLPNFRRSAYRRKLRRAWNSRFQGKSSDLLISSHFSGKCSGSRSRRGRCLPIYGCPVLFFVKKWVSSKFLLGLFLIFVRFFTGGYFIAFPSFKFCAAWKVYAVLRTAIRKLYWVHSDLSLLWKVGAGGFEN